MPTFTVTKNGRTFDIDAASPDEADKLAFEHLQATAGDRSTGEQVGDFGKSVVTGVREGGETMGGLGGDLPGMAEGATEYLGHQAQRLPFVKDVLSEGGVQKAGQVVGNAAANLNPMGRIAQILKDTGIFGQYGDTVQSFAAPTAQDLHGATSAILNKGGRIGERLNEATTYEPVNTKETLGKFGGSFLPGMATGTSELKAIETVPKMVQALTTRLASRVGAPAAGLTVSTAATDELVKSGRISPETATAINTVIGIASAGPGAAMERTGAIKNALGEVTRNPEALRTTYEAIRNDVGGHEGAIAKLKELGVDDAMLVDLGPNTKQLGLVAGSAPGPGRGELHGRLKARHEAEGGVVSGLREEAVGPAPSRFDVAKDIQEAKQAVNQGYEPSYAQQQRPADTQHIVDKLDTELGRAKDDPQRALLNKIKKTLYIQDQYGKTGSLEPSVQGLHEARRSLDRMINEAKDPMSPTKTDVATLEHYRTLIDNEIAGISPATKTVDLAHAKEAAQQKAFELGQETLNKGEGALNDLEFNQRFGELPPETHGRVQQGISHTMKQRQDRPNARTALRSHLGGETSEAKLKTAIGPEKTDRLMKGLENVDVKHDVYQTIVKGTKATEQMKPKPGIGEGVPEAAAGATAYSGGNVLAGVSAGATRAAANFLRDKLAGMTKQEANAKLKSDVASLLASKNPESVLTAAAKLKAATGKSMLPSAMLNALIARRAGGPR